MAGVTDWAFRTVCAELGAGVTMTEMVSSRALVYRDQKSAKLLRKNPGSICGAQIFGNDPDTMAEGARLALEISGCEFLDINMGCPMPKVANDGDGCGLMRTPELAGKIEEAVVKAVDVPVTVKCRLGWDKGSINAVSYTHLDVYKRQGLPKSGSPAVEVGHVQLLQAFILKVTLHGVKLGHGVADWGAGGKDHTSVSSDLIHIAALRKHIRGFLCVRCGKTSHIPHFCV